MGAENRKMKTMHIYLMLFWGTSSDMLEQQSDMEEKNSD